jgi:hypothetical protein
MVCEATLRWAFCAGSGRNRLVNSDPALQRDRLAGLWDLLRLTGWRRVLLGLLPLAVALAIGLAQGYGFFRPTDLMFFDYVTLREAGRPPKVIIIRSDPAFAAMGENRHALLVRAALQLGASRVAFRVDPGLDPIAAGLPAGRIVIARPGEPVPGTRAWRLIGPPPAPGVLAGAKVLAGAEAGLHRRQIGWLPGTAGAIPVFDSAAAGQVSPERSYLLRLSRRQNLPRINASQLLGDIGELPRLGGMVALVEPPEGGGEARVVTARTRAAQAMSLTDYNAAAIQTLLDGRGVRELGPINALLLLIAVGALSGAIYLRRDPKKILLLVLTTSFVVIVGGAGLLLALANVLVPVSALLIAQLVSALLVLHRGELEEDRRLRRFVTETINRSSRQSLSKDQGRLPDFLAASAPILGIARFLFLEDRGRGQIEIRSAQGAGPEDLAGGRRRRKALLRSARRASGPVNGAELVPGWEGPVQLAALGPGQVGPDQAGPGQAGPGQAGPGQAGSRQAGKPGQTYWLYSFAAGKVNQEARQAVAAMASEYRAIQQLRADLSEGSGQGSDHRTIDQWAGGAVLLVSDHGDQISTGMDGLETAIMVFHAIGFPVHANRPMAKLYELTGLPLAETTLLTLIASLTGLDLARISASIKDLLLYGGEMRVNCRDLDTRTRQLRVAAPHTAAGEQRTVVVEAVDVTEPQRLAELRLTVTNLLDVNIRNDLEAINFAVAVARDQRLDRDRLGKVLDQIERVTQRSTSRLADMTPFMQPTRVDPLGQAYPIDVAAAMREACALVAPLARELGVVIDAQIPEISGYSISDPRILVELVEGVLNTIIADVPQGEAVRLHMLEQAERTQVTISGGIGMSFGRLYAALEAAESLPPGSIRAIGRGIGAAPGWGGIVSYSSEVGRGYRFVIDLRRIG